MIACSSLVSCASAVRLCLVECLVVPLLSYPDVTLVGRQHELLIACTLEQPTCDLAEANVLHTLDVLALVLEAPELTHKGAMQVCRQAGTPGVVGTRGHCAVMVPSANLLLGDHPPSC